MGKKKKKASNGKIILMAFGILLFLIIILAISSGENSDKEGINLHDTKSCFLQVCREDADCPLKNNYSLAQCIDKTTCEAQCTTTYDLEKVREESIEGIGYDSLFRNNEKYIGNIVKITGEVSQVMGTPGDWTILLMITPTMQGLVWEDRIYTNYNLEERYLEGDLIETYALVKGIKEYKTVAGNTEKAPLLELIEINLIKKQSDR
jgi:hypothetical protein